MLVLNCKLGGVRGLFCKVIDARGIPRRGLSLRGPRLRATARTCAVSLGPRGRFRFSFPKELELIF